MIVNSQAIRVINALRCSNEKRYCVVILLCINSFLVSTVSVGYFLFKGKYSIEPSQLGTFSIELMEFCCRFQIGKYLFLTSKFSIG